MERSMQPSHGLTAALLFFGIYPVERLEPGVPASPFTRSVAVGIAEELLDTIADLA